MVVENDVGDSRRKFPRIATDIVAKLIPLKKDYKIKLEVDKQGTILEGILTDISEGGIGFICEGSISQYNNLDVVITFNRKQMSCSISVRHSLIVGEVSCVGAKFTNIEEEDKLYINNLVDSAMEKYL